MYVYIYVYITSIYTNIYANIPENFLTIASAAAQITRRLHL